MKKIVYALLKEGFFHPGLGLVPKTLHKAVTALEMYKHDTEFMDCVLIQGKQAKVLVPLSNFVFVEIEDAKKAG